MESSMNDKMAGDSGGSSWVRRMADLYRRVDAEIDPHQSLCVLRGHCCDFRTHDHVLYASAIEVRYALDALQKSGEQIPQPEDTDLCPFWHEGICHARDIRPLGCRTYFCDPSWQERGHELHERFHRELQQIHIELGLEYRYEPWVDALKLSQDGSERDQ